MNAIAQIIPFEREEILELPFETPQSAFESVRNDYARELLTLLEHVPFRESIYTEALQTKTNYELMDILYSYGYTSKNHW